MGLCRSSAKVHDLNMQEKKVPVEKDTATYNKGQLFKKHTRKGKSDAPPADDPSTITLG